MASTKSEIRIFPLILALTLLCMLFAGPYSATARAVVGVDDALIAIVIAGLAAIGITFVSTGAYTSLSDYVGSLLGEYADSRGLTPAGLFVGTQSGANNLGQILINNRFVQLIDGFGAFLQAKYSLADNSSKVITSGGEYVGESFVMTLPLTVRNTNGVQDEFTIVTSDDPIYFFFWNNSSSTSAEMQMFSMTEATVRFRRYNSSGDLTSNESKELGLNSTYGIYMKRWPFSNSAGYPNTLIDNLGLPRYTSTQRSDILHEFAQSNGDVQQNNTVKINTGVVALPSDDANYSAGDGAVIGLDIPWGIDYPDIVGNWIPGEWAPTLSGDPTITYDPEGVVQSQVETTASTPSVSSDPNDYQTPGLESVFPFCLPFDIYNLLSALAADPVAPSFSWRFYVPGICDEEIAIDLSPFDSVAQVVRTVELLAFIIGLALVTRERFLRG